MNIKRIYEILEPAKSNDKYSRIFDLSIIILIILNVISVVISSFQIIESKYNTVLYKFEMISIAIFTTEYLLRTITSKYKYPNDNKLKAIIKYILSPMAIIDLLAILPFYIPIIIKADLRFLRILRLTRILRILKINRYSKSLQLLGKVLKKKKEELLVTLFITMLLMLMAASIMYFVENEVQPEAFPNIIASFWWAIATLTTVGYGDVYPVTVLGKILAGIIALLGIGLVALPTGIISSRFIVEYNDDKNIKSREYHAMVKKKQYRKIRVKIKKQ